MQTHRELLAGFLNVPPLLVSEQAAARLEEWLQQHDLDTRRDELTRAIQARPEEGGWWRRNFLDESRWNRRQIEDWLEARRAYLPEREAKKRRRS